MLIRLTYGGKSFRLIARRQGGALLHWLSRSLRGEPSTNHASVPKLETRVRKEWTVSSAASMLGVERAMKSLTGPDLNAIIEEGIELGLWLRGEPLTAAASYWTVNPIWGIFDTEKGQFMLTPSGLPDMELEMDIAAEVPINILTGKTPDGQEVKNFPNTPRYERS